jgi:MFS family permease
VGLAIAVFVAGLPCAPALASINAALVRIVPEHRRGEVMGWSGTMSTVGNALGAPICGIAIDRVSPGAGFLTAAAVGGGIAVAGLVALRFVGRAPASGSQVEVRAPEPVAPQESPASSGAAAGADGALVPALPAPRPAREGTSASPSGADEAEPVAAPHAVTRAVRATRVRRVTRTRARAAVRRPSR